MFFVLAEIWNNPHHLKPFLEYYNFESIVKNSFLHNHIAMHILLHKHIGCLYQENTCIRHLFNFYTQAQSTIFFKSHLYINNKSTFYPSGFFPLNRSGICTTLFFSLLMSFQLSSITNRRPSIMKQ